MKSINSTSFYVGTYTDGDSKGIYKYALLEDGTLERKGLMAATENPSFLTKSIDEKYLLAVNEVSNMDTVGYVSSFRIQEDSLILIDKKSSGGAHPCHLTTDEKNYVVAANYTGGNMGLLRLHPDGKFSDLLDVQQHVGSGSHPRQDGPHAHSGWFTREGGLVSLDLGTNQLWFSRIDAESNKFVPSEPATFNMEEGAGPRHLTFHPDQPWIYVINELTSSISLVSRSEENGAYVVKQTVSTLPGDYKDDNTCADIHITADGKFVYASNRGHNSIAIFGLDEKSGELTFLGHESTRGENPRNFTLSPDNEYLLVANQTTDNIVAFKRDKSNGLLSYVSEIKAPTPVCLLF